jgi:VIT1/CCC1 family predicted Fe2+/Mn2+ transporter
MPGELSEIRNGPGIPLAIRKGATMQRTSLHVEPIGARQLARHYIRDVVYGANDGVITTFAVVAGVTGGNLLSGAVLVIGFANLLADGLSMGVGNYLSIRSHESARAADNLPEEEASPVRHGFATFFAFVAAGAVPLLPYLFGAVAVDRWMLSIALTLATLFGVGAARATVTIDRWWTSGLEMLGLGAVVAVVAYAIGAVVAAAIGSAGIAL